MGVTQLLTGRAVIPEPGIALSKGFKRVLTQLKTSTPSQTSAVRAAGPPRAAPTALTDEASASHLTGRGGAESLQHTKRGLVKQAFDFLMTCTKIELLLAFSEPPRDVNDNQPGHSPTFSRAFTRDP